MSDREMTYDEHHHALIELLLSYGEMLFDSDRAEVFSHLEVMDTIQLSYKHEMLRLYSENTKLWPEVKGLRYACERQRATIETYRTKITALEEEAEFEAESRRIILGGKL